eukprot:1023855-Pelagomonas_calceolata.AAC.1
MAPSQEEWDLWGYVGPPSYGNGIPVLWFPLGSYLWDPVVNVIQASGVYQGIAASFPLLC